MRMEQEAGMVNSSERLTSTACKNPTFNGIKALRLSIHYYPADSERMDSLLE